MVLISLVTFVLMQMVPVDPIQDQILSSDKAWTSKSPWQSLKQYEQLQQDRKMHWPSFFIQITPQAIPDSLRRVGPAAWQNQARQLISQGVSWKQLAPLFNLRRQVLFGIYKQKWKITDQQKLANELDSVFDARSVVQYSMRMDRLKTHWQSDDIQGLSSPPLKNFIGLAQQLDFNAGGSLKDLWPKVKWAGRDNQYVFWFSNLLRGDLGQSSSNGQSVLDRLKSTLPWTLLLNVISTFLMFFLSIGLIRLLGSGKRKQVKVWVERLLLGLYALPVFWVGTLLVVFFTTPEYGMDWFPAQGLGRTYSIMSFWEVLWVRIPHFILPIFCLTYPGLVFIFKQMQARIDQVQESEMVVAARARGLEAEAIFKHHIFPQTGFVLVTLIGASLPALVGGSVIVEYIFNLPGTGSLLLNAIYAQDWPVIIALVMMVGTLSIIGLGIADLVYYFIDPRVRHQVHTN